MEILQLALDALQTIFQPQTLGIMIIGVMVGMTVGILPGLGGTVGMSLLIPFIFGMDPEQAIPLMIGAAAVIHTADTFPSVLLGVPGSSGSQATIMDGYPLARKGEAARALSASFFSSMIGGLIGATVLLMVLPIARPLVLAFGSPELFMLAMLGLSMVAILAGKRPLRGLLSGMLGLLIGSIGASPTSPVFRFTFDSLYLFDGLSLAVLALGLFALPEILDLLASGSSIVKEGAEIKSIRESWGQGLRDVISNLFLVFRSSALGVIVGFIPGLGGAVVDWISYGIARQTVKNPEGFGAGDIRGVIAPESSNNAKEGGALIPTLLFGIPGSGGTAVLLGAFILLGLQPGPRMLKSGSTGDLDITILIVVTLAVANVFGTTACLLLTNVVSRLATVRAARLAPFVLVIMLAGAYQSNRSWGDLLAFLVIGLLGWVMRRLKYPLPPLLIGFVLSEGVERYLWLSTARYEWEWLTRPGVLIIAGITIFLTVGGFLVNQRTADSAEKLQEELGQ